MPSNQTNKSIALKSSFFTILTHLAYTFHHTHPHQEGSHPIRHCETTQVDTPNPPAKKLRLVFLSNTIIFLWHLNQPLYSPNIAVTNRPGYRIRYINAITSASREAIRNRPAKKFHFVPRMGLGYIAYALPFPLSCPYIASVLVTTPPYTTAARKRWCSIRYTAPPTKIFCTGSPSDPFPTSRPAVVGSHLP